MIKTERLSLIPATEEHFEAALESHLKLAELLGVGLADNWLVFPEGLTGWYQLLKVDPANAFWGTYFFIHKDERKLIGMGGYCGAANDSGMVEIGYAISPAYRGQGLATESSRGMIKTAFSVEHIEMVDAHTLATSSGSTRVLEKCGMKKIAEITDTEDGDIWHWRLLRRDFIIV